MLWEDVVIDRNVRNEDLQRTFSRVFDIDASELFVTGDIEGATIADNVRVLLATSPVSGDFSLKISIYLRDNLMVPVDRLACLKRICLELRCRCLVSDDTLNPLRMLLLSRCSNSEVADCAVNIQDDSTFSIVG